jgi:hypothetical protein
MKDPGAQVFRTYNAPITEHQRMGILQEILNHYSHANRMVQTINVQHRKRMANTAKMKGMVWISIAL